MVKVFELRLAEAKTGVLPGLSERYPKIDLKAAPPAPAGFYPNVDAKPLFAPAALQRFYL